MPAEYLTNALVTMLVTLDPIGLAPIFVGLTLGADRRIRRAIAVKATVTAALILFFFALLGAELLRALGVGLPAFRIAGGLLLFTIAAEMVFERREQRKSTDAKSVFEDGLRDVAAFPLAIPLMAGPGAITATILLAGRATSLSELAGLLAVIGAALAFCLAVFLLAQGVERIMGTTARGVLSRLFGVVLAALAVQFVSDGILETFQRRHDAASGPASLRASGGCDIADRRCVEQHAACGTACLRHGERGTPDELGPGQTAPGWRGLGNSGDRLRYGPKPRLGTGVTATKAA